MKVYYCRDHGCLQTPTTASLSVSSFTQNPQIGKLGIILLCSARFRGKQQSLQDLWGGDLREDIRDGRPARQSACPLVLTLPRRDCAERSAQRHAGGGRECAPEPSASRQPPGKHLSPCCHRTARRLLRTAFFKQLGTHASLWQE